MSLTNSEKVARWRAKPGNKEKQKQWSAKHEKKRIRKRYCELTEEERQTERDRARRRYARDPERRRYIKSNRLKNKFGITLEQRDDLLAAQGGKCASCGGDNESSQDWHVDHCHTTGEVRGVLCHFCNCMIGFGKDDPQRLRLGAAYLERWRGRTG